MTERELSAIFAEPFFEGVDHVRATEIFDSQGCRIAEFTGGEILHAPEDHQQFAGFLLSGKAVVTTPTPGKHTLLRYLERGEPFGIANLFSDDPFVSIIRAHGHCRVFCMPESAVRRLLESDTAFLYRYLSFLSDRIRFLNRKIGYLTAGSAERRLALYLVSLGREQVKLTASISALSDLLDVGRASLYRAFERLTADGFIRKEGRTFTLLDPDGMLCAYR